jgi:hypothetical protein
MRIHRSHQLIPVFLLFAGAAGADQFSVTLNPNYPSAYTFYNNVPVAPYQVTVSDMQGLYNDAAAYAICLDYDNSSYVGVAYTGKLVENTDLASMEASYLTNLLNSDGNLSASPTTRGQISFAIWQIMFPSSTQADGSYFPADPTAAGLELQAYDAVASGQWTSQDSSLYPTFVPDDTSAQRFALTFANTSPITFASANFESSSPAPEPGAFALFGAGLILIAARSFSTRSFSKG